MPQQPHTATGSQHADQPTVADRMAQTLKAYGAEYAFGIPGNDVLELVRACESAGIRFVLAKSEPSAAFMADAVAQLTGKPSVLILALGPGVSNGMSGIAGALMERSPVIVLGGEMATNRASIYNHQVFDHVAMATPVTKFAAGLNPARAGQQMARALDIATAHPAGPVFLNCPADLSRLPATDDAFEPEPRIDIAPTHESLEGALGRLTAARRPVALIGREALHAGMEQAVQRFIEAWEMPFLATYKAKGLIPETHPLCLGSVGLSPVVDEQALGLIQQSDAVVQIGFDPIELRDAWLDAWTPEQAAVTIDWAPQTHRIFPTGQQLLGHPGRTLDQLRPAGPGQTEWSRADLDGYRERVAHIVRPRSPEKGISPAALFKAVSDAKDAGWTMTVDVGSHRILANHVVECVTPGQLVQSNGLGCMGYGIPAAIGAQLTRPDQTVVSVIGDGCALMSLGELAVVAEHRLPIVTVVLNDEALSLIKLKQSKMQMEARAVDFGGSRFDRIAEGLGIRGVRVETLDAFSKALDEAVAAREPVVIDALVDPSEYWEQM